MREIEECTAEVFRRGEKRIKERRKKRVRALVLCVPICLTAAVWLAMSVPAMTPLMESYEMNQAVGEAAGSSPESAARPCTAVEIQSAGMIPEHYRTVTDAELAAELFRAVQSLFADAEADHQRTDWNVPAEENLMNQFSDLAESTSRAGGYTITFTAEDGSREVYGLSGNTLVNVSTKEAVVLSESQAAGLLAVLGLAE